MSAPWIVAFVVLAVSVAVLGLLVVGLMRRIAAVLEQAEARVAAAGATLAPGPGGAVPGTRVPDAAGVRPDSSVFTTEELDGRRSVVLFLSSTCVPCKAIARDLRRKLDREPLPAELVLVLRDSSDRAELGLEQLDVVYGTDGGLARAFETATTPHAFVVDETRTIRASGTPNTLRALRDLVQRAGAPASSSADDPVAVHAS